MYTILTANIREAYQIAKQIDVFSLQTFAIAHGSGFISPLSRKSRKGFVFSLFLCIFANENYSLIKN
jgi:hypothetical protein